VPIVYVSGGGGHSLSYDEATFAAICRALGPDEAQLVCVLHDLVERPFVRELPENVIAVRYAPQLRLLADHVAAVVTHGGQNTVNECLLHGRPMLVVPIGYEQDITARAVEACGAGLALSHAARSTADYRAGLLRLLREPGFREASARVGASYIANDGAAKTAELVVRLARTRLPQPPV
jgi:UDP:flavonoid glycosyltransferase YjiC (YdhE family)